MLIIGICDEEPAVRRLLNRYIEKLKLELDEPVQLLSYSNGEKLLRNYQLEIDLLFLEIPFKELSGIEIARRLRKIDHNVRVIFLTTRMNHVLEAYEVKASNYLLKPLSYNCFYKEVSNVLSEKSGIWGHYLIEKNSSGIYKIYLKSIKYIETAERHTIIHTEDGDILSQRQMKEHELRLPSEVFIRCHTGYIVNLGYFQSMEGSEIQLLSGEHIPVSRKRKAVVSEKVINFLDGGEKE
jgi:DNA-binding LytR/AlgR family response regulator